ncbi:MAG: hypothetical protein U0528_08355 [Anaerolineae bacterium]
MKRILNFAVLLLLLSLAACGGSSGPQPTNTPDQSSPVDAQNSVQPTTDQNLPPTATVDVSCRKQELEGWVQAEGQHSRALIDLLNTQALITPPDQMAGLIGQVSSAYEQVKMAPHPACAQAAIDLVQGLFELVIAQLTSYSTGQQVDLAKLVADANGTYAQIQAKV